MAEKNKKSGEDLRPLTEKTSAPSAPSRETPSAPKAGTLSLPADTSKEYSLLWKGPDTITTGKFGKITFSTLTPARAAQLVKGGLPYLTPKKK